MAQCNSTSGYAHRRHERKEGRARPASPARVPKASNGSGTPRSSLIATGRAGKWPTETNPVRAHGWSGDRLRLRCSRRLHALYWMGLVADRVTLYQTNNPAHSVTPRQQRYLAVRGASSMLEHPAFLSWSGRTGCLHPSPLRGTEGSNPSPSSGESGANSTQGFGDLPPSSRLRLGV